VLNPRNLKENFLFIQPQELKIYSPKDFPSYLPKLNSLYDDLFAGGKGFRAKLVKWVSQNLALPQNAELLLAQTIEFIHNASLLHDDLVDRSTLRRGKPAAWTKYTPEYAVLAGDYLLARVMVNLSKYGNIHLVQYTAEMISDLLEGEWLQDSVVGDFFINTQQLDQIHELKTASLFKWCLKAPFMAAQKTDKELLETIDELGSILGLLFQRSDDLLDYDIRNSEGKAILGDLKSKYLNSFGAFVCNGKTRSEIDLIVRSQTLEEFFHSVGGKHHFDLKLKEFDEINSAKIELYFHHLGRLENKLNSEEKKMIAFLRPLPDLLYWRKKPG
jgi:octaprenyl-diphosphate synthase